METPKNKFFDINKLPAQEGILLFPISMSRISNSQNAKKCLKYLEIFTFKGGNKILKPQVGLNIIYSDFLYLHSEEKSSNLKNKFTTLITVHKNEILKLLTKNPHYISKSISFTTWNQLYLETKDFLTLFGELKKIYKKDKQFQKYLKQDALKYNQPNLTENQTNFFLEEILILHLILKGKITLHNEFIQGHQKWILFCYPGKPLKSQIYLYQKNFFNLTNNQNKYENSYYDLQEQKLYDCEKIDLETLELK